MKSKFFQKNSDLKYAILLLLVTLVLFSKVLSHPKDIIWSPSSDLIEQFSYWSEFRYKSVNEFGQLPLWNPYTLSGYPYVGDPNSSHLFYPGKILLNFFNNPQFGFIFIIHFFLGGLFVYLFLKALGIDDFSSFIAGAVYILSVKLAYIVWLGYLDRDTSVMAVPLLFLLVEKYFRKKQKFYLILIPLALALQFFGDVPQFSVYTVLVIFIYYIFRAFSEQSSEPSWRGFAEQLKINFYNLFKYLSIFAIMLVLFILLSSIQLIPNLEKFQFSSRRQGLSFETITKSYVIPPYYIITMLMPDFAGSYNNGSYWGVYGYPEIASYIGILPLIFVMLTFLNRNKFTIFFYILAAFSLLFAIGKYSPLFLLFYNFVPTFNLFRNPLRMLFFFNFAMVVLVGFGTNFFLSKLKPKKSKRILSILLVIFIASIATTALIYLFASHMMNIGEKMLINKISNASTPLNSLGFYKEKLMLAYNEIASGFLTFDALLLSIILLFYWRLRMPKLPSKAWTYPRAKLSNIKLIKPLIFLIIFLDLGLYSMSIIQVKDKSAIFEKTDIINFLEKDKGIFRVLAFKNYLLPQYSSIKYNIYKVDGYEGMIMKDYFDYISAMNNATAIPATVLPIVDIYYPEMLNLLNAKYVVSEKQLYGNYYKNYELVYNTTSNFYLSFGMTRMYDKEFNDASHEFIGRKGVFVYLNKDFLPRAFVVPSAAVLDRNNILAELKKPSFKSRGLVLLEKSPNKPLANQGGYKEANITFYSPNKISVSVDTDYPGFLVLSEVWYPGWKALDNGKETEIYRANYITRSVYLDKGEHDVDFIYDPLSFKIGLWITIATLFFIMAYIVIYYREL
ncbi:YfhO family protein [Candidatus Woesearchaeota archaeon]|nr:YfhO family protein [Candidatus Woesearchaeota archaeon]